ncbi:MAG: PilZ domain-containing protein [Desulfobacterales bacterium]|nr:PilZ domain-containing protein [Desulfobacterales bacterium]
MESSDTRERRSFVRVLYGPAQRPRLAVGGLDFEIADINQSGLRLHSPGSMTFPSPFLGTVAFCDGQTIEIQGRVEWHQNEQIGLSLDRLIPERIIEKEQRYAILTQG